MSRVFETPEPATPPVKKPLEKIPKRKKKRTIKELHPLKIVFSDGFVLTSNTGEFDMEVIKALLDEEVKE